MDFSLNIKNVQNIRDFKIELSLSDSGVYCLVGKNGTGKTTIIRSIRNLISSETFKKTASPYIFSEKSEIKYVLNGEEINYKYDSRFKILNTKDIISEDVKSKFHVELAMPHGIRFSHFNNLSSIDGEIRAKIATGAYYEPHELIAMLSEVYSDNRFSDLKEAVVGGVSYYFTLLNEDYYIREDYMSSGEYFLINLYRQLMNGGKYIFIDELDISLDPSAQVKLISILRKICSEKGVYLFFTTHSLAIMKCMENKGLYYLDSLDDGSSEIKSVSYSYVKSVLFGFSGYDKYILTEDKTLTSMMEYIISLSSFNGFHNYKIIYVGGADNTFDLMKRNEVEKFFSEIENVVCVFDGDKKGKKRFRGQRVIFSPFNDVEVFLFDEYLSGEFDSKEPMFPKDQVDHKSKAKSYYKQIRQGENKKMDSDIYNYLFKKKHAEFKKFESELIGFLEHIT